MIDVLIGYSACHLTASAFETVPGVRAWTCDLLPSRGNWHRHLQCDVWEAIGSRAWAGAVLHPMCTVLTVSGAWAFKDPDFERYPRVGYHQRVKPGTLTGQARREARERELQNFRRLLALPFPCWIENPAKSFINTAIRPPDQVIHPFEFGDDASKETGLWLTNGAPKLSVHHAIWHEPRLVCDDCRHSFAHGAWKCPKCGSQKYKPRWANQTDSGQNKLTPGDDRWLERSQTYPGIARAIGEQCGKWLVGEQQ